MEAVQEPWGERKNAMTHFPVNVISCTTLLLVNIGRSYQNNVSRTMLRDICEFRKHFVAYLLIFKINWFQLAYLFNLS